MNKLNKNTKAIKLADFHLDICLQGVNIYHKQHKT